MVWNFEMGGMKNEQQGLDKLQNCIQPNDG